MKRILIFLIFVLSLESAQSKDFVDTSIQDIWAVPSLIQSVTDKAIYDLEDVVTSPEFKSASVEQRREILQKHFIEKKYAKYVSEKKWSVFTTSMKMVGLPLSIYLSYYFGEHVRPIVVTRKFGDKFAAAVPYLMGSIPFMVFLGKRIDFTRVLEPTDFLIHAILEVFFWYIEKGWEFKDVVDVVYRGKRPFDPLQETEVSYIVNKYDMNPKLQVSIEKSILATRSDKLLLSQTVEFILQALALPSKTKPLSYKVSSTQKLFENFDAGLQKQLQHFTFRQILLTDLEQQSNQDPASIKKIDRYAVYMTGRPGTGKTQAARGIAEALGLPLATLTLDGATVDDLVGVARTRAEKTPGRIAQAMINAAGPEGKNNYRNMVLFVDEFDRALNDDDKKSRELLAFMLKILDPTTSSYFNPYFDADVQLPRIVILAGNHFIKDEALKNRFIVIDFKGFSKDVKKKIVWKELIPQLMGVYAKIKPYGLSLKDLTDADRKHIDQLIENDEEPGLRGLEQKVKLYIEEKMRDVYIRLAKP